MSAIELADLSKHYGTVRALDAVSLEVEQGEFVTILGPSGSGKSTVLNLIAGLTEPSTGRILIGGRDVTRLPAARRNVGLVFQSYALFPNMSVTGNVRFPLEVRGLRRADIGARVAEALRLVRLSGLGDRRPSELSGGQQQRVALARAVVFEPEILLLDEPLAALDRKLREEVRVELRQLQRSLGITTVLVTHDQEEALSLSYRVVVLDGGRIQQFGRPHETYAQPRSRFVADFLGAANFFEGTVERREGSWVIALSDGLAVPCEEPGRPPGSAVCGVLRPERIRLADAGAREGLAGRVADAIYFGQSTRYHVRLGGGQELIAVSSDPAVRYAPGADVRASWQTSDVWLLPAEGEPPPAGGSMDN